MFRSSASGPNHVSPVAILSMSSEGRFCATKPLNSLSTYSAGRGVGWA